LTFRPSADKISANGIDGDRLLSSFSRECPVGVRT